MIRTFPYTELRTQTGDYFDNRIEMARAGFLESQMWSVVETQAIHEHHSSPIQLCLS